MSLSGNGLLIIRCDLIRSGISVVLQRCHGGTCVTQRDPVQSAIPRPCMCQGVSFVESNGITYPAAAVTPGEGPADESAPAHGWIL
eukprot:gene8988-biopygen621